MGEHTGGCAHGEMGDDGAGAVLGFAVAGELREAVGAAVLLGVGSEGGVGGLCECEGVGVDVDGLCECEGVGVEYCQKEGDEWIKLRHGCVRLESLYAFRAIGESCAL